jgi:hypothetical protein
VHGTENAYLATNTPSNTPLKLQIALGGVLSSSSPYLARLQCENTNTVLPIGVLVERLHLEWLLPAQVGNVIVSSPPSAHLRASNK